MKYLIITSSGGGAHITVAKAEKVRLNRETETAVVDIMGVDRSVASKPGESWIPNYGIGENVSIFSGPSNVNRWDTSQKMGGIKGVKQLEQLIDYQIYAEKLQDPTIYKNLTKFLRENEDLEQIIRPLA